MKTLLVCVSIHHGNTRLMANIISQSLDADIVTPEEVSAEKILRYDLIGFGSGVYFRKFHRSLIDAVGKLPEMPGKKAFVFSTSGMRELPFINDFSQPFKGLLQSRGFDIVGEFHCLGLDTYFDILKLIGGVNKGKPDQKDCARAKAFAQILKEEYDGCAKRCG